MSYWSMSNFQKKTIKHSKGKGKNDTYYGDVRYMCSKCNKPFKSIVILKKHTELHTGQFSYFCDICRKGYNNRYAYEAHMRAHQGLKFQCEYCIKQFMDRQKYQYHLSEHTGQYRFTCNKCGKGFNVKINFERHTTTH